MNKWIKTKYTASVPRASTRKTRGPERSILYDQVQLDGKPRRKTRLGNRLGKGRTSRRRTGECYGQTLEQEAFSAFQS